MKKTVTQDEYEAAVVGVNGEYARFCENQDEKVRRYVDAAFKAAGITVEPKPILPGVTTNLFSRMTEGRLCFYDGTLRDDETETGFKYIGALTQPPYREAYGKAMAGGPKLAELLVERMRDELTVGGEIEAYSDLIKHMRDVMGADVSEFEGWVKE